MADITKLLVEKKPELIEEQDIYGRTALHYAASYDAVELVNNRGQNAFHVCIGKARVGVLDCLMSKVRDDEVLNQQDNEGNTPLHLAVKIGNPKLVESMLEKEGRVDIDTMNNDNFTPLDLTLRREDASMEEIQVYGHLRDAGAKFGIVEPFNEKDWDLVNAQKDRC
ncbi:hypothetical protein HHK36_022028 [Tetracentron sinense]|uniref:Uncharacterized protein n=1 Tax=Tetracentron sinense TaxID=13715 RepID=A0A834YME9_TETSI|nr:hypothetical protein HHK36_022028 [Tetracentron sinense]